MSDATKKVEIIVEYMFEGGSFTVFGIRKHSGWTFFSNSNQSLLIELIELMDGEDEPTSLPQENKEYNSFADVLTLLDQSDWVTLHPGKIHPDFREFIWSAVCQRLNKHKTLNQPEDKEYKQRAEQRWREVCRPEEIYLLFSDSRLAVLRLSLSLSRFHTFQDLLNYIYLTHLSTIVPIKSYGKNWFLIPSYTEKHIEKQWPEDNRSFSDLNIASGDTLLVQIKS